MFSRSAPVSVAISFNGDDDDGGDDDDDDAGDDDQGKTLKKS